MRSNEALKRAQGMLEIRKAAEWLAFQTTDVEYSPTRSYDEWWQEYSQKHLTKGQATASMKALGEMAFKYAWNQIGMRWTNHWRGRGSVVGEDVKEWLTYWGSGKKILNFYGSDMPLWIVFKLLADQIRDFWERLKRHGDYCQGDEGKESKWWNRWLARNSFVTPDEQMKNLVLAAFLAGRDRRTAREIHDAANHVSRIWMQSDAEKVVTNWFESAKRLSKAG